jgi:outer membrane protein OmpA-like peptidoglycan-associated protein
MGDSDLTMSGAYVQTPNGAQGPCVRVYYKSDGPKGWAGIYWQDPANNWGDVPGKAGYDLHGAVKLSFWARGENGGERVHEFRVGGIVGQYPDSDVASLSNVRLTRNWKKFSIDLRKKDLRHIIGGFGFIVLKAENPGGMTVYLDDIVYEGPEGAPLSAPGVAVSTAPLTGSPVAVEPSTPTPTVVPVAVSTTPVLMALPTIPTKDLVVKQTQAGLRVSFSSRILFSSGKSLLAEGGHRVLDQLISLLNAYPTNRVLIEGHTDKTGDAEFNLKLSELRARSIRDYLIKQGGYAEKRFEIVGYGATRPVADNNTADGRSLNRRVEVTILKNEK